MVNRFRSQAAREGERRRRLDVTGGSVADHRSTPARNGARRMLRAGAPAAHRDRRDVAQAKRCLWCRLWDDGRQTISQFAIRVVTQAPDGAVREQHAGESTAAGHADHRQRSGAATAARKTRLLPLAAGDLACKPWEQLEVVERAFNTDQGSQFTAEAFTSVLRGAGITISMDGRGRCIDNVFVERVWRSLKYEEVFLHAYEDLDEARAGIGRYFEFYNLVRPHQALGYRTPDAFYRGITLTAA
jgi:transposase InsO family protein